MSANSKNDNIKVYKEIGRKTFLLHQKLVTLLDEYKHFFHSKQELIVFSLLIKVTSNILGSLSIVIGAIKAKGSIMYKLPLGVCFRCAIVDLQTALYYQSLSEETANAHFEVSNLQYAKSLLERMEVYKDKVHNISPKFDDKLLDEMYELGLEDNFCEYFDFKCGENGVYLESTPEIQYRKRASLEEGKYPTIKQMYEHLAAEAAYAHQAERLYHYYKYFSQYEHFSALGFGDAYSPFGNDNAYIPSAIDIIEEGIEIVFKNLTRQSQ